MNLLKNEERKSEEGEKSRRKGRDRIMSTLFFSFVPRQKKKKQKKRV